eukprot:g22981.t1
MASDDLLDVDAGGMFADSSHRLFTMDVQSLYVSTLHQEGLGAFRFFLEQRPSTRIESTASTARNVVSSTLGKRSVDWVTTSQNIYV